jgi:hypothetical protein
MSEIQISLTPEIRTVAESQFSHPDAMLLGLMQSAEMGHAQLGVTLLVHGVIVTGTLTGRAEYLRAQADEWDEAVGEANPISNGLVGVAEEDEKKRAAGELPVADPPPTIYLLRARFLIGGALVPTNRGVTWSGSTRSVDGFCIGNLSAEP